MTSAAAVLHGPGVESNVGEQRGVLQRVWGLAARVDPTVTFEEYRYWAKIERKWEEEEFKEHQATQKSTTLLNKVKAFFSQASKSAATDIDEPTHLQENVEKERSLQAVHVATAESKTSPDASIISSEDDRRAEWRQAARALRTATWGQMFYLATTDIIGFSNTAFVFASVGYGMGAALFVVFGIAAAIGTWAIWRVFLGLDSSRYPMMSYGDTYFRIYGPFWRHFINVTQSLQQFLWVAVLVLGLAQTLAQLANNKICFVVCMIIVVVVGAVFGFIRKLSNLGWLCNFAVWSNIASAIIICYAAANYLPDYDPVTQGTLIKDVGPIKTFARPPPVQYQQQSSDEFSAQFNGINAMVFSYSGALIFVAFLAEMRHPWDFWKGVFLSQAFICFVYIFIGAFVYSYFGQYSYSSINLSLNPIGLQIAANVLNLVTGFLAIFLTFNIAMKTVYLEVFQEIFHFPPISEKKGRILWYALGPVYWIIALVVSASVPNFSGITSFVGGLFSLNYTYSLPGIMYVGYHIHCGAALPGEGFDPVTGVTTRHDSGPKRWWRGYMKSWYITIPMTLFSVGGLAASGMGSWAAIEGLIAVFGPGGTVATSWGCTAPV